MAKGVPVCLQLETVSATILPRGVLQKSVLGEEKQNSANTTKGDISIRHSAQQRITRSYTAASGTTNYYERDPPPLLYTSCTDRYKTLNSRSNLSAARSAGDGVGAASLAAASMQQSRSV